MKIELSVVIPTYNRFESLRRTLESLKLQTMSYHKYEVVIADDGSSDRTDQTITQLFPYSIRYFRQENQGSAAARNLGAQNSRGWVLVYLDDDICVENTYLESIIGAHKNHDKCVVQGSLVSIPPEQPTPFQRIMADTTSTRIVRVGRRSFSYDHCLSGFFSVKREHYHQIGGMRDVGGDGRTAWGDVDFGYRAHHLGFEFYQISNALGYHFDSSLTDIESYCERWEIASNYAVKLLQINPGLLSKLKMFEDKTPVDFSADSNTLVFRKLLRKVLSSRKITDKLLWMINIIERNYPDEKLLRPLYRWVSGAYIYRGFQQGLIEYAPFQGS